MEMRRAGIASVVVAAGLAAACAPVIAPRGADRDPPRITLTALNAVGTPSFSTTDAVAAGMGACAEVRSFPANVSLAAADESGVRTLTLTVFPGRISEVSAAPASIDVSVTRDEARATDVLTVTPHPPAGRVQPNLLVTLTVSEFSALVASAYDARGNRADLYQVDLRPAESGVICSGGG